MGPDTPAKRSGPTGKSFWFFFQKEPLAFLLAFVAAPTHATILHYTARLHGLPLLDITYCLQLDHAAYDTRLVARTLGLAEFFVHGRVDGRAIGSVAGTHLAPASYVEQGRISGEAFTLKIGYPAGNPVVQSMAPPADKYRLPVPAADLPGSIDGMTAIALEVLVTSRTGACQGSTAVFDGRQMRRLTTHTAGHETLPHSARSVFAGDALRCDTQSVMLSGYLKDQPVARQARPHFSKAWLAPLAAGGDDMPVRFAFDADALGDIVVDLDRVGADVACEKANGSF